MLEELEKFHKFRKNALTWDIDFDKIVSMSRNERKFIGCWWRWLVEWGDR